MIFGIDKMQDMKSLPFAIVLDIRELKKSLSLKPAPIKVL
jgi:hypothetical protein